MRLEIRDAEDQTVYDIGPEGAVIGRERAKTDISLRDESISKRHARIFHDDGGWFVEDLGSSNGTYVDEQRISGAVLLSQGMSFSLAQRRFEILYIDSPAAAVDDFPMPGMVPGPQDETGNDMPPLPGMESQAYVPAERSREPDMNHDDFGAQPDEDDATNQGIKYFFVAVPKAVAYYLVKVPLMGLNPIGTIRRGVEEQKLPAMSKMEIAAYAIPAGFFNALVTGVFSALAVLVNGAFGAAIGALVAALPMAAISAAIGGVFGFFAHPILEFLIRLLKGESTAKSRSNYLVMMYTFVVLSAVPKGIGLLVSSLPVPFISLLGPLLTVLVSLVGLFLAYLWVQSFQMHKAVRYVVLVLGVLSVLGTGFGFVSGLITQISNLGSGSSDTPGLVADGSDLTDEQKAALEAAKSNPEAAAALAQAEAAAQAALAQAEAAGGEVDERTRAALEAARKKSAEAAAMAAKQAAAAQAAAAEAAAKTPEEPDEPDEPTRAAPPPTRAAPPPTRAAPPPTRAAPPPARAAPPRTVSGSVNSDEHPLGRTAFVAFLEKRGAVERAIDDDPSLLRRRDIKSDYERMWEVTYDIREKYRKRYRKKDRWERDKIGTRLKGQEIFEKTNDEVDRLYKTIFGR